MIWREIIKIQNVRMKMSYLSTKEFIAGWIGGSAGIIASHPFDTLKIKQQDGKSSFIFFIKYVIKNEGFHGFYKGMGLPILFSGLQNALFFGVYANSLRYLMEPNKIDINKEHNLNYLIFTSGCYAGLAQAFMNAPVERIKITLQIRDPSKTSNVKFIVYPPPPPKTIFNCTKEIYKSAGIRGFYRGILSTIVRDVPSGGLYILIYKDLDKLLSTYQNEYWSHLIAGGVAGTLSYAPVNPIDVVKTKLQADSNECPKFKNTLHCISELYKKGGLITFWRGFLPTSIRAFVNNSVVFLVYEYCLDEL